LGSFLEEAKGDAMAPTARSILQQGYAEAIQRVLGSFVWEKERKQLLKIEEFFEWSY